MTSSKQQKKTGVLKNGNPRCNGRPKGTPNKFTTLKQSFLDAFEQLGGTKGLVDWAKATQTNRGTFYQMMTRLFPQEVSGNLRLTGKLSMEALKQSAKGLTDGNAGG
jgi:hypothetical protein